MFFGRYHRRFRAVFLQRLSSGGPPSNLLVPVLRRSLRTHASCFYPAGRFRVNKLWPRKPQQNARWVRPRGAARHSNRAGPNPLGENQSLSSPPLKPRGLLLSVMRQKVGKERSQGDCHPLGHPPLLPELSRNNSSKTPGGRGGFYPRARRGPTLSGRINLFPLPRSSRGGSYFL